MSVTIRGTDTSAAAPSFTGSDGDTGIFFPAADTIAFAEGGAEIARFDSSGNLGIGTTSPTSQIQLNKSGTGDYTTLRLSNSGASGRTYEIGLGGNTSAAGYANSLYFYDSTAGAIRMSIDSSGRVTMPSQTAFYVYVNGADTYSGAGWSKVRMATFASPHQFNTSLFNFSTNMFTAPVAGRYLFSAAVTMTGSSNTDGTIGFTLNGAGNPAGGRSTAYASGTGLGGMDCVNVLNLAANDTVAVFFYQSGTQTTRNTEYAGYFCGYLLG
jgi:hypothetical protein